MTSIELIDNIIKAYDIAKSNPESKKEMLDVLRNKIIAPYMFASLLKDFQDDLRGLSRLCDKYMMVFEKNTDEEFFDYILEQHFTSLMHLAENLLTSHKDPGLIREILSAMRLISTKVQNKVKCDVCIHQIRELEHQLDQSGKVNDLVAFLIQLRNQGFSVKI